MLCHKGLNLCRDVKITVLKFASDQTISLRIINEKQSYAASEIHGRGNQLALYFQLNDAILSPGK